MCRSILPDVKVSCSFTHYSQLIGKLLEYHGNFGLFIIHFPGLEADIHFEFVFR